jgi:hypothetical protein
MAEKAKPLKEKDKELIEEIKRIKKKQKGLYQEYEIPGIGEINESGD